jgi:nucleoside-diphosphate-sugar epimerase
VRGRKSSHTSSERLTDVLLIGGSGALGRALLQHLRGREVVATTRSAEKLDLIRELGAVAVVCDVYDTCALTELAVETRPTVVANFLTDLAGRDFAANRRIRSEGGRNVVAAAQAAGARRLVVESISFGAGDDAVAALEHTALRSGLETVVLRFARLWGPGTWHDTEPDDDREYVHVDVAGRRAAQLLLDAAPGTYTIGPDSKRLRFER